MEGIKDVVDWRSEVIAFIEERVRTYRRLKALKRVDEVLEKLPETPRGLASRLVREDRDSS
jgi:hypothetical protein